MAFSPLYMNFYCLLGIFLYLDIFGLRCWDKFCINLNLWGSINQIQGLKHQKLRFSTVCCFRYYPCHLYSNTCFIYSTNTNDRRHKPHVRIALLILLLRAFAVASGVSQVKANANLHLIDSSVGHYPRSNYGSHTEILPLADRLFSLCNTHTNTNKHMHTVASYK